MLCIACYCLVAHTCIFNASQLTVCNQLEGICKLGANVILSILLSTSSLEDIKSCHNFSCHPLRTIEAFSLWSHKTSVQLAFHFCLWLKVHSSPCYFFLPTGPFCIWHTFSGSLFNQTETLIIFGRCKSVHSRHCTQQYMGVLCRNKQPTGDQPGCHHGEQSSYHLHWRLAAWDLAEGQCWTYHFLNSKERLGMSSNKVHVHNSAIKPFHLTPNLSSQKLPLNTVKKLVGILHCRSAIPHCWRQEIAVALGHQYLSVVMLDIISLIVHNIV